ncbi:PAS domain-containing protein [Rheinheimera sp. 4Y26]|uniref:sensor histidine kinase n=1 Tax=Rheinheimera sp. 4Y26 TaxID=2977811 RepID=UPI0021B0C944|nr:PAS domain-containing protein [Rheinheimera sp. 4Y26]MCT6698961.1 PAS domain-containing protein [Rheinheimera sp. 4Y26]
MTQMPPSNVPGNAPRQGPQLLALQAQILASPLLFANDTHKAWQFLTEQISRALYADRVSVWLFTETDILQCIDLFQYQTKSHQQGANLKRSNYPAYFAALTQDVLITASDAATHPATAEFKDGYLQSAGICSMLDAVIQSDQGLCGVICIEQQQARQWTVDEQHFVTAMASVASTVHTFSQHLRLQQDYQLSLARQEMASRHACIGFWEANMGSGELWWSPMVYEIFGVDPQQAKPDRTLFYSCVHPEDMALVLDSEAKAAKGGEHDVIHRIVLPNGTVRWVHEMAKWTAPDAVQGARLIGSVQDITAQQQIRAELQQFFALSRDVLCIANDHNYFERVNAAFCRILGYSEAELLSKPFTDFIHPDDLNLTESEVTDLQQGGVTSGFCNRYRHKDGHYVTFQWSSIRDPATCKMYASAQDITERQHLEQLKHEFVSTVSHELRTPLTSIHGALALVLSGCLGPLSEQMLPMLQVANNNCQRLTNLINDLLDIEKLSAGMMQLEMQPYAVVALVQQSVDDNAQYGQARSVRLVFQQAADTAKLYIRVDKYRFAQIMANLISNAVKYSPAGADVKITVALEQQQVKISVTDCGCGIPEDFKHLIFQRFSQADVSDARQKGGTGLGLALAKQLTESMQGEIGFDSAAGHGSCFYLLFPTVQISASR